MACRMRSTKKISLKFSVKTKTLKSYRMRLVLHIFSEYFTCSAFTHMYVQRVCMLMPRLPQYTFRSPLFPFCIVRIPTGCASNRNLVQCNMNSEHRAAHTLFSFDIIKIVNYMIYCFALLCRRLCFSAVVYVCLHF